MFLSSFPPLWPVLAAYMFWVLVIDKSPVTGGRSSQWFRGMSLWRYFSEYYPASYVSLYSSSSSLLIHVRISLSIGSSRNKISKPIDRMFSDITRMVSSVHYNSDARVINHG